MHYTVRYERDEDGWWVAQVVEEPAALTQGKSLKQARNRIREALALVVGNNKAKKAKLIDDVRVPDQWDKWLSSLSKEKAELDKLRKKYADDLLSIARDLTTKEKLSVRDAAELLGISHQRVQQLVDTPKRRRKKAA